MAEAPLHQRFVHGVEKHGHMLEDLERAQENARHAQALKDRSFNWPAAILAFILLACVVGGLVFLYQTTF